MMNRVPKPLAPSRRLRPRAGRTGARTDVASDAATEQIDLTDRIGQVDPGPGHGFGPERLDIERANELPGGPVEAAPGGAEAGGIEAPEGLRNTVADKAFPFE